MCASRVLAPGELEGLIGQFYGVSLIDPEQRQGFAPFHNMWRVTVRRLVGLETTSNRNFHLRMVTHRLAARQT